MQSLTNTPTIYMHDDTPQISIKQHIWHVLAQIPHGLVSSYGEVARLAGYPGYARYVGHTLKSLPKGSALPWHRVLNAKGEIAFAQGSASFVEQRRRLLAEKVVFISEKRVDLRACRWQMLSER